MPKQRVAQHPQGLLVRPGILGHAATRRLGYVWRPTVAHPRFGPLHRSGVRPASIPVNALPVFALNKSDVTTRRSSRSSQVIVSRVAKCVTVNAGESRFSVTLPRT